MPHLVVINGEFLPPEQATISVFDRGFLYGDSVFETIRTYGGNPYALDEHLNRLVRSASLVAISIPVGLEKLRAELLEAIRKAANQESYVRIMITRGSGPLGLDPRLATGPSRVIIVNPLQLPPQSSYVEGIRVVTYRTQRVTDATGAQGAKVGNYLTSVLATQAARESDAQEALIVDRQGRVVEGASSNVFVVKSGRLMTPPEEAGILPGITRAGTIRAARTLGIEVEESHLFLSEIQTADEVLITSSTREILPVVAIDGEPVGDGRPGFIGKSLLAEFRKSVLE